MTDMKALKKLRFASMSLAVALCSICLMLCGCNFNEADNNFNGGVLLDGNKLDSIKQELLSTSESTDVTFESSESSSETQSDAEGLESHDTETKDNSFNTDETETETSEPASDEASGTVYWTKSGSVWHVKRDCHYIKDKEVESGSVEEAKEAKKDHVCKSCSE